ncbi:MAG: hypothetical protein JF588_13615 [Caulobacterales bacterium]|nr:hypothetical protein [Caulobacterales bacterium]
MKLQFLTAAILAGALASGAAAAQGTFGHESHIPAAPGFGPPPMPGMPQNGMPSNGAPRSNIGHIPPAPSFPEPKPFKPYEPPKMGSVYESPRPPAQGARPCELSVYVNACQHHH